MRRYIYSGLLGAASFVLFLVFLSGGIVGGDSGDLVTAAATLGVPHPPGYPLYTLVGWLLTRLPILTIAWRVGLISALSHAAVISFVFLIAASVTRRHAAGLVSALFLLGNYLFFFYSVTPEVFGLFDLFIALLTYLLIQWKETRRASFLVAASFVFGLSLTHHHVIVFFVPACLYWVWANRSLLAKQSSTSRAASLFWFLAGLVPYAYIAVAARGTSMINWDRAMDLNGFIRLLTRADYGTFVSGGFIGTLLVQRLLSIQAYAQFVLLDFSWAGVLLIILGLVHLWRHARRLFGFFAAALFFLGPVFFFYASFPLVNRFTLGTYERFLLPSYILYSILAGVGVSFLADAVRFVLKRIRRTQLTPLILGAGFLVLLIYPVSQLGVSVWRFWGLAGDRTADHLGQDVLSPLPPDSIVLLGRDTTLFSTQYVRYALGFRPDIVALHTSRLHTAEYQTTVALVFPGISFPSENTSIAAFIAAQYPDRRIFSTSPLDLGLGWYWIPFGLTYELVDEAHLPDVRDMYEENIAVWEMLHDPTSGILSRYNHLLLSDVRDVYAGGRIALGTVLLRAGMLSQAQDQFAAAAAAAGDGEAANAYTYAGLTHFFQKDCVLALSDFARAKQASIVPDRYLTFYEGITYRDCAGDEARARELLEHFERLQKEAETPLER